MPDNRAIVALNAAARMRSPAGAVVGGLLLGIALSYVGGYLHNGANLTALAALVILVLVLMIRPDGLFSATHVRRV